MAVSDVLAKVAHGLAGAAGNDEAASQVGKWQDQRQQQQDQERQMQIAPLSQSLNADRLRLAAFVDPKTMQPLPGHEDDYHNTLDRMAGTIGQIRTHMGGAPNENPNSLKSAAARLLDATHITRDLRGHILQNQQGKVDQFNAQNRDMAQAAANSNVDFSLTPEGQKEAAKNKAALELQQEKNKKTAGGRPMPNNGGAISIKDAKNLVQNGGMTFPDQDGNPLDVGSLPEGMKIVPWALGDRVFWMPGDQKPRVVRADNIVGAQPEIGDLTPNAQLPSEKNLGAARVPTERTSSSTDPFGVTTTSSSTSSPVTPAAQSSQSKPQGSPSSSAQPPAGPKTQQLKQVRARTPEAQGSKALDDNGHIPEGAEKNDMLRSAANQLLDGMDINKLNVPQKDKQAAAHLAGQYGWTQGGFTPRELSQVQESRQLIRDMLENPKVMDVYKVGTVKRGLISQLIKGVDAKTFSGSVENAFAGGLLTDDEVKFVQTYRQLIGRIQGIALLTRGSGRPTEAAVKRMMSELPDPAIVRSPEQAKHSFELINNEIDIALKGAGPKSALKGQKTEQPKSKQWTPPADAPQAPKEDGHKLKDGDKVIAVSRGGNWVEP